MKIAGLVGLRMAAIVAVAAASAFVEEKVYERERVVSVCIRPGNEAQATYRAEALASRIFAGIGVRVVWHSGGVVPDLRIHDSDQLFRTDPRNKASRRVGVCPADEGTHIVLFYDRIQQTIRDADAQQLLAYVVAHEITHILQGIKRHSATGVMKAKWSREDFFEMGRKRLDFTPEDVDFICRGLDARATRQASVTLIAPE